MSIEKSDNEIMKEFEGCSIDAYKIIFDRYKNRLYNYLIRAFAFDRDSAQDIVQKTLIRVYEYKFKYKPTYQFSTWVYTITRNLYLNEIKRKKHERLEDEENGYNIILEKNDPAEEIIIKENYNTLTACIDKLDPKYREVIVMRFKEELTYEEIALILKKNTNTLKSLCKRGLENLGELLES